jgi:hypothetical protein
MNGFFESMESRRLFSASLGTVARDVAAVEGSDKAVEADYTALTKTAAADVKAIKTVEGKASTSDKALLKTLVSDEKSSGGAFKKLNDSTTGVLKRDGLVVIAVLKALVKKPGNAALESKLAADANKVKADTSTQQAVLLSDAATINTLATADLSAIATANSATGAAAMTATSDVSAETLVLGNAVNTLFTDLGHFTTDASA